MILVIICWSLLMFYLGTQFENHWVSIYMLINVLLLDTQSHTALWTLWEKQIFHHPSFRTSYKLMIITFSLISATTSSPLCSIRNQPLLDRFPHCKEFSPVLSPYLHSYSNKQKNCASFPSSLQPRSLLHHPQHLREIPRPHRPHIALPDPSNVPSSVLARFQQRNHPRLQ